LSFTDGLVNDAARANAPLQRVSELVDWGAIEALLSGLRADTTSAYTPSSICPTSAKPSPSRVMTVARETLR
jgi:hypothetical protein